MSAAHNFQSFHFDNILPDVLTVESKFFFEGTPDNACKFLENCVEIAAPEARHQIVLVAAQEYGISFFILVCSPKALRAVLPDIQCRILNEKVERPTYCEISDKCWGRGDLEFPLYFNWTIQRDGVSIHISELAISPAFRQKGLMKDVSVNLLSILKELYGQECWVTALCIHPATYKFFLPFDQALIHFQPGSIEDGQIRHLLGYHAKKGKDLRSSQGLDESAQFALLLGTLALLKAPEKNSASLDA